MIIQYKNYYISSGKDNKLFTLRQNVVRKIGEYTDDSTIHVKTLCANKEKAILKAQEYVKDTGFDLTFSDFEVEDRKKSSQIDWTKFQAGKYYKEHYESVCESDPEYVVYLICNYDKSEKYTKTLDLCKSIPKIKNELERIAREKKETEERIAREKRETVESNGHFYRNGDVISLSLKIVSIFPFQSSYGTSFVANLKDANGKVFVYIGSSSLLAYDNTLDSGFVNITAEIKHSSYRGLNQTHLKNPYVIIDKYVVINESKKVLLETSLVDYKKNKKKLQEKTRKLQEQNPSSSIQVVKVSGGAYSY